MSYDKKRKKKVRGKGLPNCLSIILPLIILDQIAKYFARAHLTKSVAILPSILNFTFIKNTGIGFGLMQDNNFFLIFISILIVGFLIYYLTKLSENKKTDIALSVILAGALSNLIDRIFLGHIIDFIDFRIWPVFNLADAFITVGIIYLIFVTIKYD